MTLDLLPPGERAQDELHGSAAIERVGKGWAAGIERVPRHACIVCGALHYVAPCYLRRGPNCGRFCSYSCRGAWTRAQAVPKPLKAPRQPRIYVCHCGKSYAPSYKGQRFCSLKCRPPTNPPQPKPLMICESCNRLHPKQAGSRGRFCSLKCFARYQGKAENARKPYSRMRGGKRADLENRYFRSAWEANWARYLNWLAALGEVKEWAYEPTTFEFVGIRRGSRFYTPDFRITNRDGSIEYHEIKGWMDPRSATKLKRMAKYHPKVNVIVIERKAYGAVSRKVAGMIAGWEHGTLRAKAGDV